MRLLAIWLLAGCGRIGFATERAPTEDAPALDAVIDAAHACSFAPGAPIPSVNDGIDKGFPALTSDSLTLYFESGSTHHLSQTTRASLADPFAPSVLIPNINSPSDIDEDVSITGDGLELFFASGRPGGIGGDDIYNATRACL